MNVIGIDQSLTKTGYCILNRAGEIVDAGILSTSKDLSSYQRSWDIAILLSQVVTQHNVSFAAIEGLAFGQIGNATRDLTGLQYTIIHMLERIKCSISSEVQIYAPTTVKKYATGSGKADKAAMIASLPDDPKNYFVNKGFKKTTGLGDLTDAYFIARMRLDHLNAQELSKSETE